MDKPKKYEERLMAALDFDEADLEANQVGQFSQRQIKRLNANRVAVTFGWALVLLAGICLGALVLAASNPVAGLEASTIAILLTIAGVDVLLFLYNWLRANRLAADLRARQIAQVEGRVDLKLSSGQYSSYFLNIGGMRFPMKQPQFLAFKNGDPYRIYYTPRSKKILAVEWLREAGDGDRT